MKHEILNTLQRPRYAIPLLFVLAFCLRFPYFFTPTIDWDESTFILFGQHILDGGLPYVGYFDVKPPLLFYFFAAAIKLFGATVPSVRVAGTLCVIVTACATYLLGRHLWSGRAGLLAGFLCVSGMSIGRGHAVMSEVVAMAPLMLCAYLIVAHNRRCWAMAGAGVLMGVSVLVRSNLAYVCILSAPCIAYLLYIERDKFLARAVLYISGGLAVLFVTLACLYLQGGLEAFYRAVVTVPTETMGNVFAGGGFLKILSSWNDSLNLIILVSVCGLGLYASTAWESDPTYLAGTLFLMSVLAGAVVSFFGGEALYAHYVLQLVPVLALFGGYFLFRLFERCGELPLFLGLLVLYLLILPLLPLSTTARLLRDIGRDMDPEFHVLRGPESRTAGFIKAHIPPGGKVWVMDRHIIYWLASMTPPSKYVVHPSRISMPESIRVDSFGRDSAISVIKRIFAEKPYYIVRSVGNWYVGDDTPEGALINREMNRRYTKVAQFGDLCVYGLLGG